MANTFTNPVLLEAAIRARLIASMAHADISVTIGDCRAHLTTYGPKRDGLPYIVFDLIDGEFIGEFNADGIKAMYRVTVHDHPENGGTNAALAYQGVWGNWSALNRTGPDYGLHMWKPSIANQDPLEFIARRFTTPHTPEALSYSMIFEVQSFNDE